MDKKIRFSISKFSLISFLLLGFLAISTNLNAQCTSQEYNPAECDQIAIDRINSYRSDLIADRANKAQASDIYYLQSDNVTFLDDFDNTQIMNSAYGAGNWTKATYQALNPTTVFVSTTTVVFMDGSGDQVTAFQDFLTANTALIETWVNNGGVILINAAPSPASPNVDLGFDGTQLISNTFIGSADVVNTNFPAFVGPNTPTVTPMGGAFYANARVQGPGLTTIMSDQLNNSNIVLAEKNLGLGKVLFGGMTRNSFHSPFTESRNWRVNLFIYMFDSVIQEPTIECPDDVNVSSDADACGAVVTFNPATAEDIQDGTLITVQTQGPASGSLFPLGETTVSFSATDGDNNTVACSFTVTVTDNVAPVVITQDFVAVLDENGTASINVSDIDNGSSDNCAVDELSVDVSDFTCDDIGDNVVTLSATDVNGNTSSQTAVVTVEDVTAPFASVIQSLVFDLDENGEVTINPTVFDDGSTDNCNELFFSIPQTVYTCADVGLNTMTLTVADASGNETNVDVDFTIEDNIIPTVITQDITISLDANGQAAIDPQDVNNGSFDNCDSLNFQLNINSFDCSNIGDNVVTLTIFDANANSSESDAIVTVVDDLAPVIISTSATLALDENGEATLDAANLDVASFDNCGIADVSVDNDSFDCDDVGTNSVILSVTDVNGNTSTTSVEITIEDNIAPTFDADTLPVDQTVNYTTDTGYEVLDFTQNITGTDNCGVDSITQDVAAGTELLMGVYVITITITDDNGNTTLYTFELTVEEDLGIQDSTSVVFSIYPNPTHGELNITSEDEIARVQVFDLTGKRIQFNAGIPLDVSMLQAGVYVIKVESNERSAFKRFIKK
ncbi:hypothetical protein GCM10009117_05000 [Gangjinia marincola]|uniref:HYR domain-containing protein n=1 Tax=Gangjinia marincola TaxID=578463 RepID=A0ABN1ME39_9FLAO